MRRLTTFSRGSAIPAATLNTVQDEQVGFIRATGAVGAPALVGADGRHWCTPDAGVASGTLVVVDATPGLDWRARLVWGQWARLETAAQRMQGAESWQTNDITRPIARRTFHGRTGTGATGAADATVADGTPPVVGAGSFAVVVDELDAPTQRVWLYARPSDGALCLYNASGGTLHGELLVHGAGVAPTPGAPPPSPIPTLTDVLWLDPGLAADRPADPGGPAIRRSTDTEAVEIWDGGAWRALGGGAGGGVSTRGDVVDLFTTAYALTSGEGWTLLTPAAGASASFEGGGGLALAVPAGVESSGHVGAHRAAAFPRSSSFALLARLHARAVNISTWERMIIRIGASADDCAAAILTGYGSLDLGYFDGGAWGSATGRGANPDIRTPYAAGTLVLAVRRTPTAMALEAYGGADIDTALSSEPIAVITSADSTLLRKGRGGRLVRLEAQTIGPTGAVDILVAELAIEVGGAT